MNARDYIIALARSFPSLKPIVPHDPQAWDVDALMRKLGVLSTGERHAALFIANVWNPPYARENGWTFDAVEALADWDDRDTNAFTNTIDRYMEAATHLSVVTTLPFMVDYGASLQSTLRDADNRKFDALRVRSEALLAEKIAAFEAGPRG